MLISDISDIILDISDINIGEMNMNETKEPTNGLLSMKTENIRSLRDIVVEKLREAIVSGHFKPGDHLVERELSELIGVSTTPIKEALRILGHEGLVETIPRKGTFVSELAETSIEEVQLVRSAIEGLAARLAALKATDEQLKRLEAQIHLMEGLLENEDVDQLIEENTNFHILIREIAGSPMISRMLLNIASFDKAFRKRALKVNEEKQGGYSEHREIYEAIKSKDPDLAEERMKRHILRTVTNVLKK